MKRHSGLQRFEALSTVLIIINIVIFLYFIYKLEQIERLTLELQSQAFALSQMIQSIQP